MKQYCAWLCSSRRLPARRRRLTIRGPPLTDTGHRNRRRARRIKGSVLAAKGGPQRLYTIEGPVLNALRRRGLNGVC
jgi:hypothetical protein